MPVLSPISKTALAVCLVAAGAFVVSISFMPYPGAALLKVVPVLALMAVALENLTGGLRAAVLAALVFSAIGDVTLEMGIFLLGLGAFLVAQVTYAGIFVTRRDLNTASLLKAALVLLAMVVISAGIWPHAGDMQVPVAFYMTAIGAMGVAAALHSAPAGIILAGAVTFIASDSLIGFNRFVQPVVGAREWIMITYYLAQVLLVCGIVRHANRRAVAQAATG